MAHRTEASVDIAAPPEAVFPWLEDPELLPRWIWGMVECEALTPQSTGVGSRLRQVVVEGGRRIELTGETVRSEPPSLLEVHIEMGDMFTSRALHRLEATPTGTHLVSGMEMEAHGLAARAAAPVVVRMANVKLQGDLRRLRTILEGGEEDGSR